MVHHPLCDHSSPICVSLLDILQDWCIYSTSEKAQPKHCLPYCDVYIDNSGMLWYCVVCHVMEWHCCDSFPSYSCFSTLDCKVVLLGCRKTIEEENSGSGSDTWFRAFYLVLGIYGGLQLFFALLLRVPWFRQQAEKCSNFYVVMLIKWVHQVLLQRSFCFW